MSIVFFYDIDIMRKRFMDLFIVFFYAIFVFFLIASAQSVNKIILSTLPGSFFVGLRMFLSGFLLMCLFCFRKKDVMQKAKKYFFTLCSISFFTTFIPSLMRAYGLSRLPSSRAAFWGTFEPFVTALYMYILYGEKLTLRQILGCFVGFLAGAYFVVAQNAAILFDMKTFLYVTLPDFAMIACVFVSRFGWIRVQGILKQKLFEPTELNGFTHCISGILAFIFSYVTGEFAKVDFGISCSLKFISLMIYTVIIGNMLAYTLYARLLKNQSATFVSIASLSVPLFVHLLGPLFLGENLSMAFFISSMLIFVALQLFNIHKKKLDV